MGTIRYAVRLRGRPNDAAMAALPEELRRPEPATEPYPVTYSERLQRLVAGSGT